MKSSVRSVSYTHLDVYKRQLLAGMVVWLFMEIAVSVRRFSINFMSEAAIGPSKDQHVQKSQLIVGLPLNGKLYPWVNLIEMCQEPAEFILSMAPDNKCVINIPEPAPRLQRKRWNCLLLEPFHKMCIRDSYYTVFYHFSMMPLCFYIPLYYNMLPPSRFGLLSWVYDCIILSK